jgi:hypothetical protein
MKEKGTKIMIVILALLVILDPSVDKLSNGKKYMHCLFYESFKEDEVPVDHHLYVEFSKDAGSIDSSQNALR